MRQLIGADRQTDRCEIGWGVLDTDLCDASWNTYYRFACAQDHWKTIGLETVAAPQTPGARRWRWLKSQPFCSQLRTVAAGSGRSRCVAVSEILADLAQHGRQLRIVPACAAPYTNFTRLARLQEYAGESKVIPLAAIEKRTLMLAARPICG